MNSNRKVGAGPMVVMATISALAAAPPTTWGSSLIHAYAACLSFEDLCLAIAASLEAPVRVRSALKNRLSRFLRQPQDSVALDRMYAETAAAAERNRSLLSTVDALHSSAFGAFSPPVQHEIMERWIDRGSHGALRRWIKAGTANPSLIDPDLLVTMWRTTRSKVALRAICYHALPSTLAALIPEILDHSDNGQLVSQVVVRAEGADDASWQRIRELHPATYLYLCAELHRDVSESDAVELVLASPQGYPDLRGLAAWCLGQMGMVGALDRVRAAEASTCSPES